MGLFDVLLLDFGGVCLLNPVELHHVAESTLGLEPGTLTWMGPIDPDTDDAWVAMIEGRGLTERQYWAQRALDVGRAAGRDLDLAAYMRMLFEPPRAELIRPACIEVVAEARAAGIRIAVLTNDLAAFHGPDWAAGLSFFESVDRLFDCSTTGVLKPDERAYRWVLDECGVDADRVLFVDDQPINVAGAERVGMSVHWFDIAHAADSWAEVGERIAASASAPGSVTS